MKAGDLVFCTSKGILGRAIRFAQKHDNEVDWKRNHVAVLSHQDEAGNWYVIQAEAKGVTNDKLLESVAPGGSYEVVELPIAVFRVNFLEFLNSQVGSSYSWLSILSCAVDMFLPDTICLRRSKTWICSGLVAGALWYCTYPEAKGWGDLYTATPAQVARACSVR